MPQTPLASTDRLQFRYTVKGLTHKARYYVFKVASADPSGFDAVARAGFANVGISTLVDPFFNAIVDFFDAANCTFDGMDFQQHLGTLWVTTFTASPTTVPTGVGTPKVAMMKTLSGKSADFMNFPVFIYETDEVAIDKNSGYAGFSARNKRLVDYFFNVGGAAVATSAWNWRRSRSTAHTQSWLSMINDSNEKLRRIRRLK